LQFVTVQIVRFFNYSALAKALTFPPQDANAKIQNALAGNHHVVGYAAMIDCEAADWGNMPSQDQSCAQSIRGPNP
jgi:hypothetical protein